MQPVQINNPDEAETVEVPLSEYEAVKALAAGIAEQNTLVLKSIETLRNEMVAAAENNTANMGAFLTAFTEAVKNIKIEVNVPTQSAPVVNLPAPVVEVKAPQIKLTVPKILETTETHKRHKESGMVETSVRKYKYE